MAPAGAARRGKPLSRAAAHARTIDRPLERSVGPWLEAALAAATIALLVFIRWQFVGIPMERDEGAYAVVGQRLVMGLTPYVDFYDHRPPGFFLAYGLLVKLAGYDYIQLQRAFCAVFGLILVCSHLVFRRLMRVEVALALLPVYGLALLNPHCSGFTIQSEFVVLLFACVGLACLLSGMATGRLWLVALAGAFLGWSALVKEVGLAYVGCGAMWLWLARWEGATRPEVARRLGAYAAGVALAGVAALAWIVHYGVLTQALFWIVEFPRKYYLGAMTLSDGLPYLAYFLRRLVTEQPLFWTLGAVGLALGAFTRVPAATKARAYLLVLCAASTVTPGFRFMNHYWILFMPGLAVGIALAYEWTAERLGSARAPLLLAAFVAIPAANLFASRGYYFHPDFDDVLHAAYSTNPFPEMRVVADWLNARLRPADEIFVAGSEPELYLYTHRTGISRHIFAEFLTVPSPFSHQWQLEAIADVEKAQPRFVVNVLHPFSWTLSEESDTTLYDWTGSYLPQHYNFLYVADQVEPGIRTEYVSARERPDYKLQGKWFVAVWERK